MYNSKEINKDPKYLMKLNACYNFQWLFGLVITKRKCYLD